MIVFIIMVHVLTGLDMQVALKMVTLSDTWTEERIQREIEILRELHHDHIAKMFDFVHCDKVHSSLP